MIVPTICVFTLAIVVASQLRSPAQRNATPR
jgi:hypothetical protein